MKVIWFSEFLLYSSYHANDIQFGGLFYQECYIMKGEYFWKDGLLYFKVMLATLEPLNIIHLSGDRPVFREKIYPVFYKEQESNERTFSFDRLRDFLQIGDWNVRKYSYFRSHWNTERIVKILKREFDKLYENDRKN